MSKDEVIKSPCIGCREMAEYEKAVLTQQVNKLLQNDDAGRFYVAGFLKAYNHDESEDLIILDDEQFILGACHCFRKDVDVFVDALDTFDTDQLVLHSATMRRWATEVLDGDRYRDDDDDDL
jgi:hypothetical protein